MEITTVTPAQTQQIGKELALKLKPGDVVALWGSLGAGKTELFKGMAKGFGIKQRVTSPTFIFVKTYKAKGKTINHIDLYRSANLVDLKHLGLDEIVSKDAITIIEWPEKLKDTLPQERIDVFITPVDETSRNIKVSTATPSSTSNLKKAAEILKSGGVLVFPTDTVYGIGCIYDNQKALERIHKIKNRPQDQPFPILVSSINQAGKIVQINDTAKKLMEKYWPGGLTIVLQGKNSKSKIGVRMPNSKIALSLIEKAGNPIIGTSANFHGKKPVADFESLDPELVRLADYVIKGKCEGGHESTVVDVTVNPPKVLRKGAIKI